MSPVKFLLRNIAEFLKFIGPRGQKIMRSANYVANAGPHVRQTFLNDVFTFLADVGNAGRTLLRTMHLPSLVKIHGRMLILVCSQGCCAVKKNPLTLTFDLENHLRSRFS
jgi:hypothetical protein